MIVNSFSLIEFKYHTEVFMLYHIIYIFTLYCHTRPYTTGSELYHVIIRALELFSVLSLHGGAHP